MDTYKNGIAEPAGKGGTIFQWDEAVVRAGHLDFIACARQLLPGMLSDIERESLFCAPAIDCSRVQTAMPWIKHDSLDFMDVFHATWLQNRLDNFAHVHGRDQ